jgi:hypothetical protein
MLFGLVLHGNKIWLSEFLSISFMTLLLCLLFGFTGIILRNSLWSAHLDRVIRDLHADKVPMTRDIEQAQGEVRLADALKALMGNTVADSTMYHLVALVYRNSQQFGYDPLLVLAVIHVETGFRRDARGTYLDGRPSGAMGLMQLQFATAKDVAVDLGITLTSEKDLFKPEINIPIGIAYLAKLIGAFRSFKLGLLAYNQGPGVVYQALTEDLPLSIDYYNNVLRSYFRLVKIAQDQASGS